MTMPSTVEARLGQKAGQKSVMGFSQMWGSSA